MSHDNNAWGKKIKCWIKLIREAIKPELAIPANTDNPINHRITRLKELIKKARAQQSQWQKTLEHIDSNLEGLIGELNQSEGECTNCDNTALERESAKSTDEPEKTDTEKEDEPKS